MDEVLVEMCGPSNVTCKCECGRVAVHVSINGTARSVCSMAAVR